MTGSTLGIGFAAAQLFAAEGAAVILNGRTAERVEEAVAGCATAVPAPTAGGRGRPRHGRGLQDADRGRPRRGRAGQQPRHLRAEAVRGDPRRRLAALLRGQRAERRAAGAAYLPGMRARDWGRIVFVSSESAVQIPVEMIHYGMTKTAQLAVARGLAETTAGPA